MLCRSLKFAVWNKSTRLLLFLSLIAYGVIIYNWRMTYVSNDIHNVQTFYRINEVSCNRLMKGVQTEIVIAKRHMQEHNYSILPDEHFINISSNCITLKDYMFTAKFVVSATELEFPLAFIILMYKDVEQTVRLLRAIYRPHNYYCIHVDLSAPLVTHDAVSAITSCYDNVFVVSKKVDVVYAHFSRLQAEINCMEDLVRTGGNWKYVLNLPSQEFPLKTNHEMVKLLRLQNGANSIEGISNPNMTLVNRYKYSYILKNNVLIRNGSKSPFKHSNITILKGCTLGAFSYEFVKFILRDKLAIELLNWMKDIKSPDEYYWATLNYNDAIPAVPGRYLGGPKQKMLHATYIIWYKKHMKIKCHGKFVHSICIYGIEDLPTLATVPHLFANKLYLDYQPLAYDCLEEWYFRKVEMEWSK